MSAAAPAVALIVGAAVILLVIPRAMANQPSWRRAPRAALTVWQLVSLAGVLGALVAAPATIVALGATGGPLVWVACAVSGFMLARLFWSGHRVGRRLREARARHREIVDLIGDRDVRLGDRGRVIAHPSPSAYCVPGLRSRMVLTQGAIATLTEPELHAVLAHERSHLRARHDLILEFFTVLHEAVPARLRSNEALDEVRLLVEVLADRSAVAAVGPMPVGRALVRLASPGAPEGALGAAIGSPASATTRIALLDAAAPAWMPPVMYTFGALTLAVPVVLVILAFR